MKKQLLPILLMLLLVLAGCEQETEPQVPTAKDFSKAGLTVTLTDAFEEKTHMSCTALYLSEDLACMTLKEDYTYYENTDYSAASSLEDYAQLVWLANQLPGSLELQQDDGLTWFEYDSEANGIAYRYRAYVFKSTDAFWLVQFYTTSDRFNGLSQTIRSYAETIAADPIA